VIKNDFGGILIHPRIVAPENNISVVAGTGSATSKLSRALGGGRLYAAVGSFQP